MALDDLRAAPPAAHAPPSGEGSGIYCQRCDAEDCDWFGVCPHTPQIWCAANPTSELAKHRKRVFGDDVAKLP